MKFFGALGIAATVFVAGCASYSIRDQFGNEGYVIYEPEPYILVNPTPDGAKAEIVYLPNRERPYRVTTTAGFGKADFEFDFENGWMLKGIHDKSDNTELLKTIASFIPKPPGAGGDNKSLTSLADVHVPALYRIVFECGHVCALQRVQDVIAPLCQGLPRSAVPVVPGGAVPSPSPAGPK